MIGVAGFLVTALIIIALFPKHGKFKYEYQQGRPWQHEDLVTPFDFPIMKSKKEINDEIARIKLNTKQFFRNDTNQIRFCRNVLVANIERELVILAKSDQATKTIKDIIANETLEKAYIASISQMGNALIDSLYKVGIIQDNDYIRGRKPDYIIHLSTGDNSYKDQFLGDFYTLPTAVEKINAYCQTIEQTEGQIL